MRKNLEEDFPQNDLPMGDLPMGNLPLSTKILIDKYTNIETQIGFDEVDWDKLKSYLGITPEYLEKTDELEKFLNLRKTDLVQARIVYTDPIDNDKKYLETGIRLLAVKKDNGITFKYDLPKRSIALDFPFLGHTFTNEEKSNILKFGHAGNAIELQNKEGEKFQALVSVDPQTNILYYYSTDRITLPQKFAGKELDDTIKNELLNGKLVHVTDFVSSNNTTFEGYLQVDAVDKRIIMLFESDLRFKTYQKIFESVQGRQYNAEYVDRDTNKVYKIPNEICNVTLTKAQKMTLANGGKVLVENMLSKENKSFSANVSFDPQKNGLSFDFGNKYSNKESVSEKEDVSEVKQKKQFKRSL